MKVLSLFDGIGCGMVALERAKIPVEKYVAYEIEENAIKVAKFNYPQIYEMGDVFKAMYTKGEFDLLIGGSPCTYWSIAKAGRTREITASGFGWDLFSQYVRALTEVKPKYFLYENNFSMSDKIKDCISESLCCDPVYINSADFSAQKRERYYWTNIKILEYEKNSVLFEDIIDTSTPYKYRDFSKYLDTVKISKDDLCLRFDTSGKGHYAQENRCRKINQKWNTVAASGNDKNDIWVSDCISRHLTPIEAERLQTLPDNYTSCVKSEAKRVSLCGNGWTVDVIAHIFKGLQEE